MRYRIWSMGWFRDPGQQAALLLDFLPRTAKQGNRRYLDMGRLKELVGAGADIKHRPQPPYRRGLDLTYIFVIYIRGGGPGCDPRRSVWL